MSDTPALPPIGTSVKMVPLCFSQRHLLCTIPIEPELISVASLMDRYDWPRDKIVGMAAVLAHFNLICDTQYHSDSFDDTKPRFGRRQAND